MPPSDPWLSRQKAALKLKGHGVTLDVADIRAGQIGEALDHPAGGIGFGGEGRLQFRQG